MKNLALFLLSGFLLFSARVTAQTEDCGFSPLLKTYTVDLNGRVSAQIVGYLEDGQNCLNENLIRLKMSVKDLQSALISNDDLVTDILNLEHKLEQTELHLHTAETKIETLEDRLNTAEERIKMLEFSPWMRPHPASRNAAASKPKAPASKPKTPVNQAKPAVDSPKDR